VALSDWSTVAASNATVLGINIGEGCPPGNVNDAIRQALADVATGINISTLGTFLSSTTLAQARTALGVPEGSTSVTNFNALTNAANKVPYMTGSDGWDTTDFTSFGRSIVATGDAAALLTLAGGIGVSASSFTSSSGHVDFTIGSTTFKLQWVDASIPANSTGTSVTYPTAYTSWSRAWCSGSSYTPSGGANPPSIASSTTTGASVVNGLGNSASTTVFSIGV
jgi:hypothetical protein